MIANSRSVRLLAAVALAITCVLLACARPVETVSPAPGADATDHDKAIERLAEGVHRFQTEDFGKRRTIFEQLADHQSPIALFITCSDSRVDPSLLTRMGPGDLFVLRNAGDIVPPYDESEDSGEAATIEYAVRHLGVRDIVVCGHSNCGAMKGLLHPEELGDLPAVRRWLRQTEATREVLRSTKYASLSGPQLLDAAVEQNVLVQIEHLVTHPAVAEALTAGKLHLHGWVYRLETGEVFGFDPSADRFVPLTATAAARTALDEWVKQPHYR